MATLAACAANSAKRRPKRRMTDARNCVLWQSNFDLVTQAEAAITIPPSHTSQPIAVINASHKSVQ
jgi:hypothetical protein